MNDETEREERLQREVVRLTTQHSQDQRQMRMVRVEMAKLRRENQALKDAQKVGPRGVTLAGDEMGRRR